MSPSAPESARRLIVNADDFGQSGGINDGIIECHEHGVLTSASLMVRWPSALAAAEYARRTPTLSVGLHLDLGEWTLRGGEWTPIYGVVALDDAGAVRTEILRQLETFRRLIGCHPTHIDSHQHVHRDEPVRTVIAEISDRLGVPVRQSSAKVRYLGGFYGQGSRGEALESAVTVEHLIGILRTLPDGTTELGCHPGARADAHGMYVLERDQEVHVLCDPRVRGAIQDEGIDLISFRDLT
ncbi:MAG TPA: ChbG/HpnK family deacetylase [Vicinamibacterales bacterium]|nr:ChbG/HpnK family deacetylase [Vicinamibacterales bacterium]